MNYFITFAIIYRKLKNLEIMTTEMGESLCYSWLKHIKGCHIVQTNWKASMNWDHQELDMNILKNAADLFKDDKGETKYSFNKQTYTPDSILKTTECDVLGVKFQKSKQKVFAVEVAFHENGLDYGGSKDNTILKVLSKCIRIAMCLRACFDTPEIEIFFATPVIKETKKGFLNELKRCFKRLNDNSAVIGKGITFSLLANDDFRNCIVKPLLIRSDHIADTSELFVRSCQLLKAVGSNLDTSLTKEFLSGIEPISDIAWNYMIPILKKMKKKDLEPLTKEGNLGLKSWSVLSKSKEPKERYYASPIKIDDEEYYFTNHWTSQNKDALIQWIIDHSK